METRRDVFQAIADPTRRAIIDLLARAPQNLNDIAGNFSMSRPAVSQHIKVLTECGLLLVTPIGRERHCAVQFDKLKEVAQWAEQYSCFWTAKLDGLEAYLAQEEQPIKKKKATTKPLKNK